MALKTYQTRTLLEVLERQSQELLIVEDKLTQQVAKYFNKLEKQVQKVVNDNQDLPADTVAVLVNVILEDMTTKYRKLLYKHLRMTEQLSKRHTKEIITLQQRKRLGQKRKATDNISFKDLPLTWLSMKAQTTLDKILGMNVINPDAPYRIQQNKMVHDYLRDHSITVSEKTRNRINKDIQEILTTSEKEGIGNKQVADKIKQKFNQLETWEARRIARTEINAANNLIAHNELLSNDLVDYKMWVATSDNRTRDTHRELNGEITRIGHPFSNGLQYPGDHNGELKEFINCRCRVISWIPDYDKVPPTGKEYFRAEECIQLPKDEGQQVIIQLPENVKLLEVRQGYMEVQAEQMGIRPYGQQSLNSYIEDFKKLFMPTVKEGKNKKVPTFSDTVQTKLKTQPEIKPVKSHQQLINEYEQELKPVLQEIDNKNNRLTEISSEIVNAPYKEVPEDTTIKQLEDKIKELTTPKQGFTPETLPIEKQEEWKQLSTQLLQEATDENFIPEKLETLKAKVRVFLKRNTSKNKFDINNLSHEEQKQYKELIELKEKEGKLSFIEKHTLKDLEEKGRLNKQIQEQVEQLEAEIQSLKNIKEEKIARIDKALKNERKQLEQQIETLRKQQKEIELKIGKQHLQNGTKPSHVVTPKGSITKQGQNFNRYDGIAAEDEDYHNFCQVLNSQESNTPHGIRKYSEGSGHFNRHIELKKEGNLDKIEDNILNALVHPDSIYKLNDASIITPLDKFECKNNPQLIKDAVKKLKKKLHAGDSKVKKAYDDLLESFEREEQDFLNNTVEFKEHIVTFSGQNSRKYGHLKVGDDYEAPKCVSSSLTEEETNYFIGRIAKKGDTPVKIRFLHQPCTKQVVIGERSLHPNEAEIVQIQGTKGKVIDKHTETFEYFDQHWKEITIDVLDILLECQK
jgi:SPP1 gp7 family putative phage head morphogenesis protein